VTGAAMKIMWLNESLVFRGETVEEKKSLNVLFQVIGNDGLTDDVSHVLELGNAVDILEITGSPDN
jgi:hypothetical protein